MTILIAHVTNATSRSGRMCDEDLFRWDLPPPTPISAEAVAALPLEDFLNYTTMRAWIDEEPNERGGCIIFLDEEGVLQLRFDRKGFGSWNREHFPGVPPVVSTVVSGIAVKSS